MKSKFDTSIYQSAEEQAQDESLSNIGGFLSQESVRTAEISNLNKPKPGSFGEFASSIADQVLGMFNGGDGTLARVASGQPIGKLFYYENRLLIKTPFNTIVGGQIYINALQERVLQLTSVSSELEIDTLKSELKIVTSGSFFGLIKLAFKNLFKPSKGKING